MLPGCHQKKYSQWILCYDYYTVFRIRNATIGKVSSSEPPTSREVKKKMEGLQKKDTKVFAWELDLQRKMLKELCLFSIENNKLGTDVGMCRECRIILTHYSIK